MTSFREKITSLLSPRATLLKWLLALIAIYVALVFLNIAVRVPLHFDSALHALFPKNFLNGFGWAESYHGKVGLWIFSTGPLITVPGIFTIAIFGNQLWVPGLTVCLINLGVLFVFFWQTKKIISDSYYYYAFVFSALFFFLFYESEWWGFYLGEISSFLLLLTGAACLAATDLKNPGRKLFIFGIIASLSLEAKVMSAPGLAGMSALAFLLIWLNVFSTGGFYGKLKLCLLPLAGFFVAQIPFRLFEIIQLYLDGRYSYLEYLQFRRALVSEKSSPILQSLLGSEQPFSLLKDNIFYEYEQLKKICLTYGFNSSILAAFLLIFVGATFLGLRTFSRTEKYFLGYLLFALLAYLAWYFFLAHIIFDRHAIQLVLLALVYFSFLFCRIFGAVGLLCVVIVTLFFSAPEKKQHFLQSLLLQDPSGGEFSEYNRAILETRDYILQHPPRLPLANCGWMGATREIEFLLPKSDNFRNCYEMIEESLVLTDNGYLWKNSVEFTLLVNNISWAMSKSHENNKKTQPILMRACKKNMLHENKLFRLMECRFEDLTNHIPLDKNTPFMNSPGFVESLVNMPALLEKGRDHSVSD